MDRPSPPPTIRPEVAIYVDGSCLGNPGPGGYGTILVYREHRRELSKGFLATTSNRMELMSAIAGFEALKRPCQVTVWTDSQYLALGIERGWAKTWRASAWRKNNGTKAVKNVDLWDRLLRLCAEHTVEFVWIPGHTGNVENEQCDKLARRAARDAAVETDIGYSDGRTINEAA